MLIYEFTYLFSYYYLISTLNLGVFGYYFGSTIQPNKERIASVGPQPVIDPLHYNSIQLPPDLDVYGLARAS